MFSIRRATSPHAARLRRDQTDVEQRLWLAVRARRLDGLKFRRQATVGPFIVDFLCHEAALVVELDGGQHGDKVDAARTRYLEQQGLKVLRFWNNEVIGNMEGVLETVLTAARARTVR